MKNSELFHSLKCIQILIKITKFKDLEQLGKPCEVCLKLKQNPPKTELKPWSRPTKNWKKIHIESF